VPGHIHIVPSMPAASEQFPRAAALPREPSIPREPSVLTVGIRALAALQLLTGLFMAAAPHAFFKDIGPFGTINTHYIRDLATFYLADGFALAMAVRRVSWRVPALALSTVQFALHSLNHLLDIEKAHPAWNGYFDFFSLTVATLLLLWLWRKAAEEASA
jgi:hypothetical protein